MLRIASRKRERESEKISCASCDGCTKRLISTALKISKYHAVCDGNWCSDVRCEQKRDKELAYEQVHHRHPKNSQSDNSGLLVSALHYRRPRVVQKGGGGRARAVLLKELVHASRTHLQNVVKLDV
eukprot:4849031-Pleurochrysis_carterae.AAC.2